MIMIVGQQTMGWVPLKTAIAEKYNYSDLINLEDGSSKSFENGSGYTQI
jgi:hypothetical protein